MTIEGQSRRWSRGRWAAAVAFPVLLWAFSTLFLGGDLGKWNDDYFFLGQFDRDTGEVRAWTLTRPLHFWRPLYRLFATPLNTLLFDHDRVNHIITACVHGLVCLGLFGLLRRLGAARAAAALGAMLFMVYPVHFEGSMWNTVMFTPLATGVMMAVFALAWRWHGRGGWWAPVAIGVLTFAAAGMNEQPAAMAGGLAVLGLLAPRGMRGRWQPTVGAAAGIGAYLVGQSVMTRYLPRPVPMGQLPERGVELAREVWRGLTLDDFGAGALKQGWGELGTNQGMAWGAALLVGVVVWARWARGENREEGEPSERGMELSSGGLALLGAAVYVVTWLPIARVDYATSSRLHYAPDVGLAMMIAAGLTAMGRWRAGRRIAPPIATSCVLCAVLLCAVMMVGVQSAYRARFAADEAQGAELMRLVPDPGERAIFVPVHIEDRPIRTGRGGRAFDGHFLSPWRSPWAAGWYLQRLYGRGDVFACIGASPGEAEIRPDLEDGKGGTREFTYGRTFAQPHPRTEQRRDSAVKWNQAVLFAVNEHGRVVVVTRVRIERPDGSVAEFEPRRTKDAAAGEPKSRRVLVLRRSAEGKWEAGLEREGEEAEEVGKRKE